MSFEIIFADKPRPSRSGAAKRRIGLRIDGEDVDVVAIPLDNADARAKQARRWAQQHSLDVADVDEKLRRAAILTVSEAQADDGDDSDDGDGDTGVVRVASHIDDQQIVELAYSYKEGGVDFIVFDRASQTRTRSSAVTVGIQKLLPPKGCEGVVTPGGTVPGMVFVPTDCDESGHDEIRLREDIEGFITRYVELPGSSTSLAVQYVLLTYVLDDFDEVPYLAFKSMDAGRGKSRALETVGAICYRAILCGGGSTAAATLRLLDIFGGTLVVDEADASKDTELTSELTKILNQGFQRNRPLVRCTGEDNSPRAFRCFGGKVFALRRGFGDDATESRTITIRMVQRTRSDIPISLPRQRFDLEARSLRNRLTAWRFRNLGRFATNPEHMDPRLEDRFNQIGLPLMAVAGSDDARAVIIDALVDQQGNIAADRADSLAGEIFDVILGLTDHDCVRPGEVAIALNHRKARAEGVETDRLKNPVKPHKVGRILKHDLELKRVGRGRRGVHYRLTQTRREELCKRYGGSPQQTTQSSHRHTDENRHGEKTASGPENGAVVDCVDRVVSPTLPPGNDDPGNWIGPVPEGSEALDPRDEAEIKAAMDGEVSNG